MLNPKYVFGRWLQFFEYMNNLSLYWEIFLIEEYECIFCRIFSSCNNFFFRIFVWWVEILRIFFSALSVSLIYFIYEYTSKVNLLKNMFQKDRSAYKVDHPERWISLKSELTLKVDLPKRQISWWASAWYYSDTAHVKGF